MKERRPTHTHPRRVNSRFLLSGLAKCGYCGKSLVGQDAKSGKFSYYVCGTLNKKGAGSCQAKYLNSAKFERLIVEEVKEQILTPENLTRLVEIVNNEMDNASRSYRDELEVVSGELIGLNRRLGRLYEVIENGALDFADLAPRIKELRSQQENLQRRHAAIQAILAERKIELVNLDTVTSDIEDMHNLLSEGTLAERRAFIKSFVRQVTVAGDEVSVAYTPPLPPEHIIGDKDGVLATVRNGGR